MTEYLPFLIAAAGALIAGILYGRRWGYADGHAEGYEAGHTKGLFEGTGFVSQCPAAGREKLADQATTMGRGGPGPAD